MADEVTFTKRVLLISLYSCCVLLTGGTIFGFAALKSLLISEQQYAELCQEGDPKPCSSQLLKLDLMFSVGGALANAGTLIVGILLDHFGPFYTSSIGGFLYLAGCILFGFSDSKGFDAFLPAFLMFSLGGPCIYLSGLRFAQLFPKNSTPVLSLITGCFGASSIVFFFFELGHSLNPAISHKSIFLVYCAAPVFVLLVTFTLVPRGKLSPKSYQKIPHEHEVEHDFQSMAPNEIELQTKETPKMGFPDLSAGPLQSQILSLEFLGIASFASIYTLRLNFVLGTLQSFLISIAPQDVDKVQLMTRIFSLALPIGGIVFVPVVGLLCSRLPQFGLFAFISILGLIFSGLVMIPYLDAQFVSIALFIFFRPLFFTSISTYCSKIFGFATFGKTLGGVMFLSGVISLLQYLLNFLTLKILGGNFFIVQSLFLALTAISLLFPLFLFLRSRRAQPV